MDCGLLVDYCEVFISCLDSHSDGTHSLQRIHRWSKFSPNFIFGWTILLTHFIKLFHWSWLYISEALLMNHLVAGHIVLDEDQERTVLVVSLGVIPPLETINILVSTSSELRTLPNGGIRVSSPPVCSPRVQRSVKEEQAFSPSTARRCVIH